jgi:UDP-3-O-[3-hydroxymyristoyl] glucosamine N-acyltransferase
MTRRPAIHPSAQIGAGTTLGECCVIGAGVGSAPAARSAITS